MSGLMNLVLAPAGHNTGDAMALCDRITDFGRLPTDWTGNGAIPPRAEIVSFACNLVRNLPNSVDLPHASPSADGEIGFVWDKGEDRFEAMLEPDGHLVWIKVYPDHMADGGDIDLRTADAKPFFDEVVDFLR